jgi:putative mRNA 3-end processing factor
MKRVTGTSPFEFHNGLHLKNTVLWFDAPRPRQLCFISHANVSHALVHQKILTTDKTAELLRALAAVDGRGRRVHEPHALVTPYRRLFSIGQLTLELFPSGHLLGSASLLLQHQGSTIVYAGDINPRKSPLTDRLEARHCEVLALPCRFSQRRFVFPPFEQVAQGILRFANDCLGRGETPIFFCSPLGEAQEVAHLLLQAGVPLRAHRRIYGVSLVYERAGLSLLQGLRRYSGPSGSAEALLWPIALRHSPALAKLQNVRTAFISGMALDEETRSRMGCEAAFALSNHADYGGLLEYVRACQPKEVVLTRGAAIELREDLLALGIKVSGVGPPHQMELF